LSPCSFSKPWSEDFGNADWKKSAWSALNPHLSARIDRKLTFTLSFFDFKLTQDSQHPTQRARLSLANHAKAKAGAVIRRARDIEKSRRGENGQHLRER
jgi:hypothetical protein